MTEIRMDTYRRWSFEVLRREDDAEWPDERPQRYSSVGRKYRPTRLYLAFVKRDSDPVRLDDITIYGPRIVKAGPVGAVVDERLYTSRVPESEPWIVRAAKECTAMIDNDLHEPKQLAKGADRG